MFGEVQSSPVWQEHGLYKVPKDDGQSKRRQRKIETLT